MGKSAPAGGNYGDAAQKDFQQGAQANRPNQSNAFGSSVNWSQGPDGQWNQSQSFGGPLGGAAAGLQQQAADSYGKPMDWSQFGQLGNGDQARDQAITAAYGQATSRLNPQWEQRGQQMASTLANQGLDPNSQAYRNAMQSFGQQQNDAYGSAMNSAIGMGQAAGDSVFRNNLASRGQAISEALKARGLAAEELGGLGGFLNQQGFGGVQGPQGLSAMMGQDAYNFQKYQNDNFSLSDLLGGVGDLAGSIGSLGGLFGKKK
jgi:hypothetical protein